MPNDFVTPEEMGGYVIEHARKACKGDEKLMVKVLNSIAGSFMNMDMKGESIIPKRPSKPA